MNRRSVVILVAVLAWGVSTAAEPDRWDALVGAGRELWTTPPDPAVPVACETCHHDPEATRGWAASFPRFRPLPPPHARVMTLLQAVAEAVERHYPELDARRAAIAIAAYLTAHGSGRPISPGVAPGEPVFEHRMAALAASVARGRAAYAERCARCHAAADVALVAVAWWRLVRAGTGPPEVFLETHEAGPPPLAWDSAQTADVLAFLAGQRAGLTPGLEARLIGQEAVR